jgi:hypothetical protein
MAKALPPKSLKKVKAAIADITQHIEVEAVDNVFAIDFQNKAILNIDMETEDATAKSVTTANVPARCELCMRVKYTNAAAMTWFSGITWLSGSAPTLEAGKTYRIVAFTENGGTAWQAASVGGW